MASVLLDCLACSGVDTMQRVSLASAPQGVALSGDSFSSPGLGRIAAAQTGKVYLIACTHSLADVPSPLRRCFTHEIAVEAPDAAARTSLLQVNIAGYFHLSLCALCWYTEGSNFHMQHHSMGGSTN